MEPERMKPGGRDEYGKFLDQLSGIQQQVRGPVAPCMGQLVVFADDRGLIYLIGRGLDILERG